MSIPVIRYFAITKNFTKNNLHFSSDFYNFMPIILGQCIDTCKYADKNEVDLKDLMGFDVVSHFSFLCHFTNQDKEKTELNKNYLLKLSKNKKIIALPEEDTIYYENGKFEIIGNRPFYIFEEGNMISYNVNQDRLTEFLKLNSNTDLR